MKDRYKIAIFVAIVGTQLLVLAGLVYAAIHFIRKFW
jgi:hypothetical protein